MTDAILLASARGGRNKPCSRRHALRLTLLVDFASENYPIPGRNPSETWTIFIRSVDEVLTVAYVHGDRETAMKRAPWKPHLRRDTIPEALACRKCGDKTEALKCVEQC